MCVLFVFSRSRFLDLDSVVFFLLRLVFIHFLALDFITTTLFFYFFSGMWKHLKASQVVKYLMHNKNRNQNQTNPFSFEPAYEPDKVQNVKCCGFIIVWSSELLVCALSPPDRVCFCRTTSYWTCRLLLNASTCVHHENWLGLMPINKWAQTTMLHRKTSEIKSIKCAYNSINVPTHRKLHLNNIKVSLYNLNWEKVVHRSAIAAKQTRSKKALAS